MKLFKIIAASVLFLLLLPLKVNSQTSDLDSLIYSGIKDIYNINFENAETKFRRIIADHPHHPAGRFFLAMIDWWRVMLDPDSEEYDDIFFQKIEDVIFQCDEILKKDPTNVDALFFKGGAIGFRGRLRAYRESWLKAADDGREALPIVERAANLDPDNLDVQLGFGIYNYYAEVIPNEYPLLKPLMLFFPKGDKQKGIQQLNNTAMHGKFAKYEARYFLLTLYYSYENDPYKADEYADLLINDFPNNPTFQRWKGRISVRKADYGTAYRIFSEVLKKADENQLGYNTNRVKREAAYYVGMYFKNLMQADSARHYFNLSAEYSSKIDKGEHSGFLVNAVLYSGMMSDLFGNREEAITNYNRVLKMKEYLNSHSVAKQYLENPYRPLSILPGIQLKGSGDGDSVQTTNGTHR